MAAKAPAGDRVLKLGVIGVGWYGMVDLLQFQGLDAVIIATPPHWHALQFIAALEKGLDVYCEKPISYDLREGRAMVEAAGRSDRVRVVLGESTPKRIVAAGGLYELKGKITTPDTLSVNFEFARCGLVWRHRIWGAEEYTPEVNNGIFF